MRATKRILCSSASLLAAPLCVLLFASPANAQSIIRNPNPPKYKVEIEPHVSVAPDFYGYGGASFGLGARFSIPVMSPGFIRNINDSIAISLGPDFVNYTGDNYTTCDPNGCTTYSAGGYWALYSSVAMQWNFFLTRTWSVFAEPGLGWRHGFFNDAYCPGRCVGGVDTIYPTLWAGARVHFSDGLALTLRAGYPVFFSVGLSFFVL